MQRGRNFSFWKRQTRSNYVMTLLNLTLVLFILGGLGGTFLAGYRFINRMQTELTLQAALHDHIPIEVGEDLGLRLQRLPYVADLTYISQDEAAELLEAATGEDVRSVLGINPLPATLEIKIQGTYLDPDSIEHIKTMLEEERAIREVIYWGDEQQLQVALDQVKQLGLIAVLVTLGLGYVCTVLIFNTIRMAIYARRMNLRTLELLGATRWFIRRPFLWRGTLQGMLAGILAAALLSAAGYGVWQYLASLNLIGELPSLYPYIGLLAGIVFFGIIIGWIGSFRAVNRYLNKSIDELV